MTDQIYKPTSKKDMKAAFPIQHLAKQETKADIHVGGVPNPYSRRTPLPLLRSTRGRTNQAQTGLE